MQDIHVYYLTDANMLISFYNNRYINHSFTFDLGSVGEGLAAAPTGKLAMVWHLPGYPAVSGLVTVWQKPDGSVWLRNGTDNGNPVYQLPVTACNGTGLALIALRSPAEFAELRLFYAAPVEGGRNGLMVSAWRADASPRDGWDSCR
jgi:hypothetical protein